jgi:lactoylglutathione lyase
MKKAIIILIFIASVGSVAMMRLPESATQPVFNHMALNVYDLQKTGDFYEKVIGLRKIEDPFKDNKHIWFHLGDHCQLHLIAGGAKEQVHPKDSHLSVTVPSVEEYMDRLKKMNVSFTSGNNTGITPTIRADGVKQIFLQDPDGSWVEVNNDRY